MKSRLRWVALFLVALTAQMALAQAVVRLAPPPPPRNAVVVGRPHSPVSCGPQDINAGTGDDTCGFQADGFARPGPVWSGCRLVGLGGEMDGCFVVDTGDDDKVPTRTSEPSTHVVFKVNPVRTSDEQERNE
jgi:hypothetical protein